MTREDKIVELASETVTMLYDLAMSGDYRDFHSSAQPILIEWLASKDDNEIESRYEELTNNASQRVATK